MLAASALVALPVAAAQAAASEPFQNGTFQNGSYHDNGSGFDPLGSGSTDIQGWTVTNGSVDWVKGYHGWTSPDGGYSLDMNGNGPGAVAQTFDTVAGATYAVQWRLASNTECGPSTKSVTVTADSASKVSSSAVSAFGPNTWDTDMLTFTATDSSTTLTMTADPNNTSACGVALDDVTVTRVLASGADCKDGGWASLATVDGVTFRNQGQCVSYYATGGQTPIGS